MKRKHQKTLEQLFSRPTSGSIKWNDIEALLVSLGSELSEREGPRIGVRLFGERRVFHRPHPSPDTDRVREVVVEMPLSFPRRRESMLPRPLPSQG